MRSRIVIALSVLAASTSLASQQPAPSFRAGIDLLTIEASVVDADGRPIDDLGPGDFTVTVDGSPRRVLSARFLDVGAAATAVATEAASAASIPAFAGNSGAQTGRMFVFVVDRESIIPGSERVILNGASSVLDSLGPADAAGILGLPEGSVELTREHDRIRQGLLRLTGARPMNIMQSRDRYLDWEEALAYERRDSRVIAVVLDRECYRIPAAGDFRNTCPDELVEQAREMLTLGRAQARRTLASLRSLIQQLAPLRGPKRIVLLSAGLPFGQDLLPEYNAVISDATDAEIVLHVVHLDQNEGAAEVRHRVTASPFGGREYTQGLGALSAGTGGAFFNGVGAATGVFEKIRLELRSFYQLGVETVPADLAGASKRIEVSVGRQGASVRAGRRATLPGRVPPAATDRLAALLQQPTDLADLPVAVAAYNMRGDEASTLRVIIAAEVGDGRFRPPAEWAFAVFSEGNLIATARQKLDAMGPAPVAGAISAKLQPGRYRLRIAATDADGRPGVADLPLVVGLRAAGALQFSDLMLGLAGADGRLQARSAFSQGETLFGLAEMLSADPTVLERTRAVFEISQAGAAEPLKRFLMSTRGGASATLVSNQIEVSTATLQPGIYFATMIPHVDDKPVGRVSRRFEITAKR